jgi:hypothetical protein
MRLVELPEAGDRVLYMNPDQVVCLIDSGNNRTQVVTTGLSGETSISLIVALSIRDTARALGAVD